ncbi:MAG: site-2 protease family protein [Candidatus Pacebacteria bacterium]|nr:site-2 protease family protein [Candidatus Paceibacterota bacterium]
MDPFLIFYVLALIFSIIIHEVSHGFAAEWLGDPTARLQGRLTLNPIPHIDPIGSVLVPGILVLSGAGFLFGWAKPVPYNPYNLRDQKWGEAIVAGAGPGVNMLLAVVFGLVIRFGAGTLSSTFIALASVIVLVNIMLAIFNLLPIPPLDGSKILRSALPWRASTAFQRFETMLMSGGIIVTLLILWMILQFISPLIHLALEFVFTLITGIPLGAVL